MNVEQLLKDLRGALTGELPTAERAQLVNRIDAELGAHAWDEATERERFEAATYDFYPRKRAQRRAEGGPPIFMDTEGQPVPTEQMFRRYANGNYEVIVYQAAWSGWRMARGG